MRDLLRAIADPHDPAKRLRAWLTPFFALSLADLPAAAAGGDQPLIDRLLAWHAAAESGDLAGCSAASSTKAALARRELFAGDAMRRLTNFQQLFELLAVEAARAARPLGDIARRLAGLVAKLIVPEPEEGNTPARRRRPRRRADHDHAPGQGSRGRRRVRLRRLRSRAQRQGAQLRRRRPAAAPRGTPAPAGDRRSHQGRSRRRGPAPLLRRADAGPQAALPARTPARSRRETLRRSTAAEPEDYWKLVGGYRHVNRRLRELSPSPTRAACSIRTDRDRRARRRRRRRAGADRGVRRLAARSRPPSRRSKPTRRSPSCAARGRAPSRRRTAASSRRTAATGRRRRCSTRSPAPTDAHVDDGDGELPGGQATGIFLHALLEELPLPSVRETPDARRLERARRRARRHRAAAAAARTRRRRAPPRPAARPRRADRAAAGRGRRARRAAARREDRARDGVPVPVPRRGGRRPSAAS